jgi:enediyne biosynthesis protein E4
MIKIYLNPALMTRVVMSVEWRMRISALLPFLLLFSCDGNELISRKPATLFVLRDANETGVTFTNQLEYTEQLNPYVFRNFYNGGGVGIGDINNDGLTDIFFAGNLVSNKLYLNKGNFQFEDITVKARVASEAVWTTGVSMVDINSDGLLDIYICKSGPPEGETRHNELFINNGDLTFSEEARKYGLAAKGLSTHAAFFDYDKDGDLDCYLLNNSMRSVGGYDLRKNQRDIPDPEGGNRLYRNDNGKFTDVSASAGIYSSAIGFGLGITIGDINKDGWQDMYVSNDFFEKDYLYINDRDGTFSESIGAYMPEISLGSMGADMADINNDGLPEIFVTEMLPDSDERLKTTSQFEHWNKYRINVNTGYHHQFSRNVLQLNNGDGTFSDISRLAGVHATDWSWGALIFDMDNDGRKDIFVANGIYKDLLNQDYVNFVANPAVVREIIERKGNVIKQLIDSIPSNKIPNYAFHNSGNFTFQNRAEEWGIGLPSHSNGSAYADLDNDGDVDLVLNNINSRSFLIENRSRQVKPSNNYISFSLTGKKGNHFALGSKVTLKAHGEIFYQELSPMRGFMSSVDYRLHFGLGATNVLDTVIIEWPNNAQTILKNLEVNKLHQIHQPDSASIPEKINRPGAAPLLTREHDRYGINFAHVENEYSDFDRDRLLFNMISNEGPCLCKGDVNNDKRDDVYVGGAKGQAGALYIQQPSGAFRLSNEKLFAADSDSEDTDCVIFDADGNGFQDLYVTSGGSEFPPTAPALADRLYLNRGREKFERSQQVLPVITRFESTSTVEAMDYDKDGDQDLFVGARLIPFRYGLPANGYILNNDGKGTFSDVTKEIAPPLLKIGMITDTKWIDVNNDSFVDLIVVGEWQGIKVLINENGHFQDRSGAFGFENSNGWYNVVEAHDFNNDGFVDIVAGNHGLNSRFKATVDEPVNLYVADFDHNGSIEQILTRYDRGESYPLVLRHDLITQIPSLKKKYLYFQNYRGQKIDDIFSKEQLDRAVVLSAFTFETSVWLNNAGKIFEKRKLPVEAQFSPVYAILPDDFDHDGQVDLLIGGNLSRAKPETGIYSGSYGLLLKGDGKGNFSTVKSKDSGVLVRGEIRAIISVKTRKGTSALFGKNNEQIDILKY